MSYFSQYTLATWTILSFSLKSLSKKTPNRDWRKKMFSLQTELITIEFVEAVRENELRKPIAIRKKLPPFSIFACPNLHHTTHWSSPPQRLSELCVELGNILKLLWAMIQRFVFDDFPFSPIWIWIIDGFFWVYGFHCCNVCARDFFIIYGINVISWLLISKDKVILARSKAIWWGYYIQIWCWTLFHTGFQSSLITFSLCSSKSFNRLMGHLYFLFYF